MWEKISILSMKFLLTVISDTTYAIEMRKKTLQLVWGPPDLPEGFYMLQYVSAWKDLIQMGLERN